VTFLPICRYVCAVATCGTLVENMSFAFPSSGEEAEPFISCTVSLLKMAAVAENSITQWQLRWLVAATAGAALHRSCSAGSTPATARQELETAPAPVVETVGTAADSSTSSSSSSSISTTHAAMLVLLGRCMLQWAAELQQFSGRSDWLAQAQQLPTTTTTPVQQAGPVVSASDGVNPLLLVNIQWSS
jgi:hypothetical protein